MEDVKVVYKIGNSSEDASYLYYGFLLPNSDTRDEQEPVSEDFRWVEKVSAVRLPFNSVCKRISLKCCAPLDQDISIYRLSGNTRQEIGRISVPGGNKWILAHVADIAISFTGGDVLELVAEKEILGFWRQNCYRLSEIVFEFTCKPEIPEYEECFRKDYSKDKYQLLFGDPHVHSNASLCSRVNDFGTLRENIDIAIERGLDFISFTDHPEHFTHFPELWDKYVDVWGKYNKKPFVVLPGYEWSSKSYGNWNIYFDTPPDYANVCHTWEQRANSLPKIISCCEKAGRRFLIGTHHTFTPIITAATSYPMPEKYQSFAELYSGWGQSEIYMNPHWSNNSNGKLSPGFYVDDMLRRDMKLGFIGGSDCHQFFPGEAAVTGAYAEEFSAKGIFDAILARRTYATTVIGLKLNVKCNGFPMGHIFKTDQYTVNLAYPLEFEIDVEGTSEIECVELICNGFVVIREDFNDGGNCRHIEWEWERRSTELTDTNRYYYVRVKQKSGSISGKCPGIAACSPFWVDYMFRENPIGPDGEKVFIDVVEHSMAPIKDATLPRERKRKSLVDI